MSLRHFLMHYSSKFSAALGVFLLLSLTLPVMADDTQLATENATSEIIGPSGLPLPRFVSLKPARVNLRIGPGRNYAVSWLFLKSGLPVEIIQEYDNWRRIRDADGTEGWVYQSLLSGKRTAITAPWSKSEEHIEMHSAPSESAGLVAKLTPGVIGDVLQCNGNWCRMQIKKTRGWVKQSEIWGAYPDEVFD